MKVLIACEFSGVVREAFRAAGHDAVSIDFRETYVPGKHIEGDVLPYLKEPWDLVIAHPPCTYLAQVAYHYLGKQPGRIEKMIGAAEFFNECLNANAPRVCVENPVMHSPGQLLCGTPAQRFQPWQFGDQVQKKVCLWLRGLPPLTPTHSPEPDLFYDHVDISDKRKLTKLQRLSGVRPSTAIRRSIFFPGVAKAMAEQWGSL